jgi:mannosyltransferase
MPPASSLRDAQVLVVNLHRRYAGVSATVRALVPVQRRTRPTAVLDRGGLGLDGTVGLGDLLRHGWRAPRGSTHRIWHARRAKEQALGLFLRHVLRQPWKLVYTCPSPRRHGAFWRALVNRASAIIAVSEGAAAHLDWHTAVVPHGVDLAAFTPPGDKLAAWRESGLPGKYGIGTFGRIRPSKGTDLFVRAMCELLPRHPDFTAIVTGICKGRDRAFHDALLRQVREAGLEERILFLGDLSFDEIKLWYRRISLCVAAARSEGFGLTPMEAMASGTAAVTSSAGYFPWLVVPGVNGALVPNEDAAALTRAIEELIGDPEALLRLGESARRHVAEHCSIEREVEGIHAVYDRVLAGA